MTDAAGAKVCLQVQGLEGFYGETQALHGVDFEVREGEVVCLLGRNGAGKTTSLRAIVGLLQRRRGTITVNGQSTTGMPAERIARLGVAYCPEERAIFGSLTVRENLTLPPVLQPGGMGDEALMDAFPNLRARAGSGGTKLSGGEQQMLAIARILRTGSRFLLLDEPSEGLAPVIVKEIGELIQRLKAQGFTILLVEQNLRFARSVADRHVVVENGRVVDVLTAAQLDADMARVKSYLGV